MGMRSSPQRPLIVSTPSPASLCHPILCLCPFFPALTFLLGALISIVEVVIGVATAGINFVATIMVVQIVAMVAMLIFQAVAGRVLRAVAALLVSVADT